MTAPFDPKNVRVKAHGFVAGYGNVVELICRACGHHQSYFSNDRPESITLEDLTGFTCACSEPTNFWRDAIADARFQTARVRALVGKLEAATPKHSLRYSCVTLARGVLERAEKFLASPDADDYDVSAVYSGSPTGHPWVTHRGEEQ